MRPRPILIFIFSLVLIDWMLTRRYFSHEINPLLKSIEVLDMTKLSTLSILMLAIIAPPNKMSQKWTTPALTIIAVLMLSVVASNITIAGGEWTEYQYSKGSPGFQHTTTGHWTDSYSSALAVNSGNTFEPLIADVNNDASNELVLCSGNYLQIYNGEMGLVDEANLGAACSCQPILTDFDADNIKEVSVCANANMSMYEYNAGFTKAATYRINFGAGVTSPKCNANNCYFLYANTTGVGAAMRMLLQYNLTGSSRSAVHAVTAINIVAKSVPALLDIDRDGRDELITISDNDGDGNRGVSVIDTGTRTYDPYFSTDGVLDDISTGSTTSWPIAYNIDGAGDSEILLSYSSGSATWNIVYLKANGDALCTAVKVFADNIDSYTTPAIFDALASKYYGAFGAYSLGGQWFYLWGADSACVSQVDTKIYGLDGTPYASQPIIASQVEDYASSKDSIITSRFIIRSEDYSTYLLNYSGFDNYTIAVGDLNNDGEADIVGSRTGKTIAYYSTFTNAAPVLRSRTYGRNYPNPICAGSTLTFSAYECGTEPCHYTNDVISDTERLLTTCGTNSTYTNGTLSSTSPSVSCYYPAPGNYNINIYLQDNTHLADFTQYKSEIVLVVNGTPGSTCNLPATTETLTGSNVTAIAAGDEYTSEAEIQYVVDTLTGQSAFMEAVLVLIFTCIAMFAMFKAGVRQVALFAIAIFALWTGFALLGILSWVYVVIFALVAALIAAASFSMGGR